MSHRVGAQTGAKGIELPNGWVLDGGDQVVVSDETWANIQADKSIRYWINDLGTTTDLPDQVPTWRDIQRVSSGSATGLEATVDALNVALGSHVAATEDVHGIDDTALLATKVYVDTAIDGIDIPTVTDPYFATFNFASASDTWTINHSQGTFALHVEVFDTGGEPKEGNVRYLSANVIEIDFYYAESGFARVWSTT